MGARNENILSQMALGQMLLLYDSTSISAIYFDMKEVVRFVASTIPGWNRSIFLHKIFVHLLTYFKGQPSSHGITELLAKNIQYFIISHIM